MQSTRLLAEIHKKQVFMDNIFEGKECFVKPQNDSWTQIVSFEQYIEKYVHCITWRTTKLGICFQVVNCDFKPCCLEKVVPCCAVPFSCLR